MWCNMDNLDKVRRDHRNADKSVGRPEADSWSPLPVARTGIHRAGALVLQPGPARGVGRLRAGGAQQPRCADLHGVERRAEPLPAAAAALLPAPARAGRRREGAQLGAPPISTAAPLLSTSPPITRFAIPVLAPRPCLRSPARSLAMQPPRGSGARLLNDLQWTLCCSYGLRWLGFSWCAAPLLQLGRPELPGGPPVC